MERGSLEPFLLERRLLLPIALPREAGETEEFAAQQICLYLGEILGVSPPVAGPEGLEGAHFLLGEAKHMEVQRALPREALKYLLNPEVDVVAWHIEPERVVLSGSNPRSVLFCVYRFLERHFGARFFGPGRERIPRASRWALPPLTLVEAPAFRYRGYFFELDSLTLLEPSRIGGHIDWLAKVGMNCLLLPTRWWLSLKSRLLRHIKQRGLILFLGHHNADLFLPPQRYFRAHPDFFALVGGRRREKGPKGGPPQICPSNPKAREHFVRNLLKFVDQHPEADWLGLVPNEGEGFCQCPNCRRLGPGGRSATSQYLHLAEAVAGKLRRFHPRKVLALWAEGATMEPPLSRLKMPENSILAPFRLEGRCYEHLIFDPSCSGEPPHTNSFLREALMGWLHAIRRVCLFHFMRRHQWRSLPKIMPGMIREELRFYLRAGVEGVFTSAEWGDWEIYEPNLLAHASFSWNPNLSEDAFLLDYADLRFEGAGEHAERALSLVERAMAHFSLPGEAYPEEHLLEQAVNLVSQASDEARAALGLSSSEGAKRALRRWGANLEYTRRDLEAAFLSLVARRKWAKGDVEEALSSLRRAIEVDQGTLRFILSEDASGAVVPSERYLLRPIMERLKANRKVLSRWEREKAIGG